MLFHVVLTRELHVRPREEARIASVKLPRLYRGLEQYSWRTGEVKEHPCELRKSEQM